MSSQGRTHALISGIIIVVLAVGGCSVKSTSEEDGKDEPSLGHNAGANCLDCHSQFKISGTVYKDSTASTVQPGSLIALTKPDGGQIILEKTNSDGNFFSAVVEDGPYLIKVADITSRHWHSIPDQGSCNVCHKKGGNVSATRTKVFPTHHTEIPTDNDCAHCHHFPAGMSLEQLETEGALNAATTPPSAPGSRVEIGGRALSFNPDDYTIATVRPDIFAPGFFSMFDVILAVAARNSIPVTYHFDDSRKSHFIDTINHIAGDYWYHFAYDVGTEQSEITYKRAYRWDEALWRPGVRIRVVEGENLAEIKAEYLEETARENALGHVVPMVRILLNPSNYRGNPPESHRISVVRDFANVPVTPHNFRSAGYASPYAKPFQPGVVTSIDILHSLMDAGQLNLVTQVFYTFFAQKYIHSYYVVAMGFPGVGIAHASGRQGFVYVTSNGTFNRLPNDADSKFHMTSDISVVHAPDFSYWRWVELGNPYYESTEPSMRALSLSSVKEDYESVGRGYNLHKPVSGPNKNEIKASFNIFEPGDVELTFHLESGERVATLYKGRALNNGIYKFTWNPGRRHAQRYFLAMRYNRNLQIRLATLQ